MLEYLETEVVIDRKHSNLLEFTQASITTWNNGLPKKSRLTPKEVEIFSILVLFRMNTQDPLSKYHHNAYNRIAKEGKSYTRNAIIDYLKSIKAKQYITLEEEEGNYTYEVSEMFRDWDAKPRKYSYTIQHTFDG